MQRDRTVGLYNEAVDDGHAVVLKASCSGEGARRTCEDPIPGVVGVAGGAGRAGHGVEGEHAAMGVIRWGNRIDVPPVLVGRVGNLLSQKLVDFALGDVNTDDGIAQADVIPKEYRAGRAFQHLWGDALDVEVLAILAGPGAQRACSDWMKFARIGVFVGRVIARVPGVSGVTKETDGARGLICALQSSHVYKTAIKN